MFPRIRDFKFEFDNIYNVPANRIGRLDLISYDRYENYSFYKAIAYANNIRFTTGSRPGIRPLRESIERELVSQGLSGDALVNAVNDKLDLHESTVNDWNRYGDSYNGYSSQVYEGKTLYMPTYDSALKWMRKYEYIGV